ncbi:hypothetical protein Tco_1484424 [Tanacetum coccineum]
MLLANPATSQASEYSNKETQNRAIKPNGSQVVHEDLEQILEDDRKEIDLKWQLALLSLKARKFYQRTGPRNQESRTRNQESRPRSQESLRRTVNVEESSSKAMLAIDGVGIDWSFMTEEEIPTNFALMAFSRLGLQQ